MTYHYRVFGLNIESVIPFLDIPQEMGEPDVRVSYGRVPDEINNATVKGVRFQAGPDEFLLHVDNVAKYHLLDGRHITIDRHPSSSDHEVLLFFMSSVMGAILHQRNILPLHGSAVVVDGGGVIFVGPSAIGKSTLAGGFQKRGYSLLADDICAVRADHGEGPQIIPGFPRLKLWADTLKKLEANKNGLNRIRLDQDFEKFFVPFAQAGDKPTPVRSVFVLETTNTDRFEVIPLAAGEKIEPVLNHTYRPRFLEGLGGKKEHFRQCAAVAAGAAVFTITRPKDGFRLDELMNHLERHW
ncbi:MAG: hypothetical protein GY846_17010 [Deltaproteobacteria bacterium]|nr:hypothetical protein [Deltaproteobacteria bacterium]